VLLLVLVLENSAYLAVKVIEQNDCRKIGLSFRRRIEHEHDDEHEHDSLNFGIQA